MSFVDCQVVDTQSSSSEYHQEPVKRGDALFKMSYHHMKDFAFCPSRWVNGYRGPDTDAKDWGSALDCLWLTPEEWPRRYVVRPETYPAPKTHAKVKSGAIVAGSPLPWNANATYCDEWEREQKAKGLELVKAEVNGQIHGALHRLRSDPHAEEFLRACVCQVWIEGLWSDPATGLMIPVKCLVDAVPKPESLVYSNYLGDLKTTRTASPGAWKKIIFEKWLHVQAAFYLDLYNAATGEARDTWVHILVENFHPYEVGRRLMSQRFLEMGRFTYTTTLRRYAECLKKNIWPSYDDPNPWTLVEPDDWMVMLAMEAAGDLDEPEPESGEPDKPKEDDIMP